METPITETVESTQNQSGKTFHIEELTFEGKALKREPIQDILKKFDRKIEAIYENDKTLVDIGFHSFLRTVHLAYAEHRPLVLSPDMIWFLISQGFGMHINALHGTKDDLFPQLKKKRKLIYKTTEIELGKTDNPWHKATDNFSNQIGEYVDEDLVNTLRADFSTTGIHEKMVSEITIMNTFKAYFDYIIMYCICGIPTITLEGTKEDWTKVYQKTEALKGYKIDDWIEELLPLLKEFIAVFDDKIDIDFWRNLFKIHTSEDYGNPKTIDGWITKFYPYDKDFNRINLAKISRVIIDDLFDLLPKEIVNVDFEYHVVDVRGMVISSKNMEMYAGFVGATGLENHTVRPEIGWFITYAKEGKEFVIDKEYFEGVEFKHIDKFPTQILKFTENLNYIHLWFNNEIEVPDEIQNFEMLIELQLRGKISRKEIRRLRRLLPRTMLYFNGKEDKGSFFRQTRRIFYNIKYWFKNKFIYKN